MLNIRQEEVPDQKKINETLVRLISQITNDELRKDDNNDLYEHVAKIIKYEVDKILPKHKLQSMIADVVLELSRPIFQEEIRKFYLSQEGKDLIKSMHDDMSASENIKTTDDYSKRNDGTENTISNETETKDISPRQYYDDGGWNLAEIVGGEEWLTDDEADR